LRGPRQRGLFADRRSRSAYTNPGTGTDIRAAAELLLESVDDLVALARRNGLGHEPEVSDVEAEADALREAIAEAKQADIEIQSRAEQWR
jgi:hypothetical protein